MSMFHAVLQTFSPTNIQSLDLCYRSLFQMSGSGPGAGAASVPTFQLSDQDQEERRPTQSQPSANNLLSVPTQIKYECSYKHIFFAITLTRLRSNIGVNNPLNKSAGQFPLLGSQQVAGAGSATGNPRNKVGLAKGFGLMDWIRLSKSGKDLTGVGGPFVNGKPREVTKQVNEGNSFSEIFSNIFIFIRN